MRIVVQKYNLCFLIILLCFSCTKDVGRKQKLVVDTTGCKYNNVKPFVLSKCAVSGCHVSNFPFGDFTTYSELKTRVDNGRINILVYENQLMPPQNSVQLTNKELEELKCWIDDGAKEN